MEIALLAWGAAAGPASSPVATTCRSSSCTRTGEPEAAAGHPAPQLPGGPGRLGRAARRDGADQPTAARSERPLAGPGSLCRPPCRSDVACTGFSWLGGGCTAEDVEHDSCVSANIRSPGYPTHTSKRFAPVGRSVHHRAPAVNPCHSCLVRGSPPTRMSTVHDRVRQGPETVRPSTDQVPAGDGGDAVEVAVAIEEGQSLELRRRPQPPGPPRPRCGAALCGSAAPGPARRDRRPGRPRAPGRRAGACPRCRVPGPRKSAHCGRTPARSPGRSR